MCARSRFSAGAVTTAPQRLGQVVREHCQDSSCLTGPSRSSICKSRARFAAKSQCEVSRFDAVKASSSRRSGSRVAVKRWSGS